MDAATYHSHECPAYKGHQYKNPLEHKLREGRWKIPGATVSAKGRCLTDEEILAAVNGQGASNIPKLRFPWLLLSFVGGIVAALVYTFG